MTNYPDGPNGSVMPGWERPMYREMVVWAPIIIIVLVLVLVSLFTVIGGFDMGESLLVILLILAPLLLGLLGLGIMKRPVIRSMRKISEVKDCSGKIEAALMSAKIGFDREESRSRLIANASTTYFKLHNGLEIAVFTVPPEVGEKQGLYVGPMREYNRVDVEDLMRFVDEALGTAG